MDKGILHHQMGENDAYDAFSLQAPPENAEICGMTKEALVVELYRRKSPYKELLEFHSWGYAQGGDKCRRSLRKGEKISILLRILFNQDFKHQPRSWNELNDLRRDAGPRLLKPAIITGNFVPISRYYPDPPEPETQVKPGFARPYDAPETIADAYLERMALPAMAVVATEEQRIGKQVSAYGDERQQAEAACHIGDVQPGERVSHTDQVPASGDERSQAEASHHLEDVRPKEHVSQADKDLAYEHLEAHFINYTPPEIGLGISSQGNTDSRCDYSAGYFHVRGPENPTIGSQSFAGPSIELPATRITMPPGKRGIDAGKWKMTDSAPIAEDCDMRDENQDGIHLNVRIRAIDRKAHLPIAEEIERVVMAFAYCELERHPTAASLEAARPYITATGEKALTSTLHGLFPVTSKVKLAQDPKAGYSNLRLATEGQIYPFRGRGPVSGNFTSAVDCAIVAGRLLDAGSTKIDRKQQGWQDRFTDIAKAFIEATDMNWDVLTSSESVSCRDLFLQVVQPVQPGQPAHVQLEDIQTLRNLWNTSTQDFDQFRLTYTEIRGPYMCDAREVTTVHGESTFVTPSGRKSDHGSMKMQDVLSREFANSRLMPCEKCGNESVICTRKYQQLPLRLAVELPPDIFIHSHTQDVTFAYRDEQGRERKATYRWLGGIYSHDNHMRLFWTDAKRGEHRNPGSLRMYDSTENLGLIVGGIPPAGLVDRVSEEYWRGKQVPLLFYERIMNPSTGDLHVALSVVSNLLHSTRQGDLILQQNPGWVPSEQPGGPDVYPWEPKLYSLGRHFYQMLQFTHLQDTSLGTSVRARIQEQSTSAYLPYQYGSTMSPFPTSDRIMDTADVMMTSPPNPTGSIWRPRPCTPAASADTDPYIDTPRVSAPNSTASASRTVHPYATPGFHGFSAGGFNHSPSYGQYPTAMEIQQVSPVPLAPRTSRSINMGTSGASNADANANANNAYNASTPTKPWRYTRGRH